MLILCSTYATGFEQRNFLKNRYTSYIFYSPKNTSALSRATTVRVFCKRGLPWWRVLIATCGRPYIRTVFYCSQEVRQSWRGRAVTIDVSRVCGFRVCHDVISAALLRRILLFRLPRDLGHIPGVPRVDHCRLSAHHQQRFRDPSGGNGLSRLHP